MNPVKDNRFKIYSFLAILEIIFLNPISISAGIVALVHAANFNASHKSERWNDFKRQKKHAGIALLVGLGGVILQIEIIVFLLLYAQSDRIDKASEVYYQFTLEGKEISLPMSVEELESAGIYFTEDVADYQLNPGGREMLGCTTDSYRDQNYTLVYVTVLNPTDELISLNDGIVVGMDIHNIPKMDGLKITYPEISLMEEVNFDTSERKLLKLYGEPDDKYEDTSSDYTQYVWHQEGYDENYYNLILVYYMNGRMTEVTIQHNPTNAEEEESNVVEGPEEVIEGYVGAINKIGEIVIPCIYDSIDWKKESIVAYIGEEQEYYTLTGEKIDNSEKEKVFVCEGAGYIVEIDSKYGVSDKNGNVLIEPYYEILNEIPGKNLLIAQKDSLCGVIDLNENIIVPFIYDSINPDGTNEVLLRVCKDNKYGCLETTNFTEQIPLEYHNITICKDGSFNLSKNRTDEFFDKEGNKSGGRKDRSRSV